MKTVVSINLGNFGSTGRIMIGIARTARKQGYVTYNAYPNSYRVQPKAKNDIIICSTLANRINQKLAYITGMNGCFATLSTMRFLHMLDRIKPDILHFHNLHNSYLNIPMLFRYVKKKHIRIVWTLHDCWPFTGHCPYFTFAECDKWKTGCGGCRQLSIYPPTCIDNTRYMWKKKKKWFTGVEDLTIVTPSHWLAGLVQQSFLADYPVKVINNGIDLSVFKPTESDFRERHGINQDEIMILGVALDWSIYKGLDVFAELANRLPNGYRIVLVGTNEKIERHLPNSIISIRRTNSVKELAEIYTAADVFVNPTRQDNFPTVNIEALSCGTPVITFDTDGSPEIIDQSCGSVVPYGDTDSLEQEILRLSKEGMYSHESCIKRSKKYQQDTIFQEYVKLYEI